MKACVGRMNVDEQDWSVGSCPPSEHDEASSVEGLPATSFKTLFPPKFLASVSIPPLPTALVVWKVPIFEHVNVGVFKGSHLREQITRHEFASFACIQNTNLDNIASEEREPLRLCLMKKRGICFLCGRLDFPTPCCFNGLVHVGMIYSHHFCFYQERICNQIGKTISSV